VVQPKLSGSGKLEKICGGQAARSLWWGKNQVFFIALTILFTISKYRSVTDSHGKTKIIIVTC